MPDRKNYRIAAALAAISLALVLDACACRPLRVGVAADTPPTTVAELRAALR
jgi:hypothetical protein